MTWGPLLEGDDAARARDAIAALLEPRGGPAPDGTLGTGAAGLALAYAELARAGDDDAAERAHAALAHAFEAVGDLGSPWLAGGVLGVAFTAAELADVVGLDDDVLATFDRVAADVLAAEPWPGEVELLYGLAGVGAYARARGRIDLVERAVAHLARGATRDARGATWIVRADQPPRVDLGMAHGSPGAIALLAGAAADGVAAARPLLADALAWLDAHARPRGAPVFPMYVGIDPPGKIRNGWCYGDLPIALTMVGASDVVDGPRWRERARAIAAQSLHADPIHDVADVDLTFCHGVAGRAHLLHRLARALDDAALLAAARSTYLEALARLPAAPPEPGLLIGRAGIALALHGAIAEIAPRWDRAFGLV